MDLLSYSGKLHSSESNYCFRGSKGIPETIDALILKEWETAFGHYVTIKTTLQQFRAVIIFWYQQMLIWLRMNSKALLICYLFIVLIFAIH